MKPWLLLGMTSALALSAETVRLISGETARVPASSVTAAYSLDSDCAEAVMDTGAVVITGRRACSTHVVVVGSSSVLEIEVQVAARKSVESERTRIHRQQRQIQESGSIASSYSSRPAEVQTSLDLTRSELGRTTHLALAISHGYAFSRFERRSAVPIAAINFLSPATSVTLLDSLVDQSALTLDNTTVRGLHIDTGKWFLHGGLVSLSGFRERLLEQTSDRTFSTGYRAALSVHGAVTTSVQWISASRKTSAGRSGVIGSAMYEYLKPERVRFQVEGALSNGIAGSSILEVDSQRDRVRMRVRATPAEFTGLSTGRSRGVQASGSWTRRLSDVFGLDISGTRDTYTFAEGGQQTNSTGAARLQLRLARPLTLSGGAASARFTRRGTAAIDSLTIPIAVNFDTKWFGNAFQYQFGRNRANELGGHALRNAIRVSLPSLTFTAYGQQQSQAPTLGHVLTSLPWLRQALLLAGASVQTPGEVQDFIRTHADLVVAGYVTIPEVNISPVRRQVAAMLSWTAPRRLLSARAEWRWDDNQRVNGRSVSVSKDARLSIRLPMRADLVLAGSLFEARLAGLGRIRAPLLSVGLRVQLANVPDRLRPSPHGRIQGVVFSDPMGTGRVDSSTRGVAGVSVLLDAVRRTTTNEAGAYSFNVVAGRHSIEIVPPEGGDKYIFTTSPATETTENTTVNFGIGVRKATVFGRVRNDAGKALGGVRIRIEGVSKESLLTSTAGAFSANRLEPGAYAVSVDTDSLPNAYALDSVTEKRVTVDAGQPARIDFVVRAIRSLTGQAVCKGAPARVEGFEIRHSNGTTQVATDALGRFAARNLPAGEQRLTLVYGGRQVVKVFELGADPETRPGSVVDVCRDGQ